MVVRIIFITAPISLRLSAQESLGKTKPIFLLRRAKIPWNGSGTFVLDPSFSPEVDGTTIEAGRYNGLTSDIAAGITNALTKDGQNVPTANLPMGSRKLTGLAAGAAAGDSVRFEQANVIGETTVTGSASLADIFAAPTARVLFDGTGITVTAFPASSLNTWKLVRFNGVNTLVNSASLMLSGGGNITTASGDVALVLSVGSNSLVADYFAAAGPTVRLNALASAVSSATLGNGDYTQRWNWSLTSVSGIGMRFSESSASSGSGATLVAVDNASGSTARPFISQWTGASNGLFGWSVTGGLLVQAPTLTGVAGQTVAIQGGGAGSTTSAGGDVTLTAGASGTTSGTPGNVTLTAGAAATGSNIGGHVILTPGERTAADSGAVVIDGGPLVFEGSNKPTVNSGCGTGATIDGTNSAFTINFGTGASANCSVLYSRSMGASGTLPMVFTNVQGTTISANHVTAVVAFNSSTTFLEFQLKTVTGAAYNPTSGDRLHVLVIPKGRGI